MREFEKSQKDLEPGIYNENGGGTMRKDFGSKPWLMPEPVLIIGTYDENGHPDAMNAAWGGLYDADLVELCLSAGHKTTKNILARKEFTVSFATKKEAAACDYVGLVSANSDPGKLKKTGWTISKASAVDAPVFRELPLALECVFEKQTEDGNIIGRIVNVSAEEDFLDREGKPDILKMELIAFDPIQNEYLVLKEKAGKAFSDGSRLK